MTATEVVPAMSLVAFGVGSALLGGQGRDGGEGRLLVGRGLFPVAAAVAADGADGRLWTARVAGGGDVRVEVVGAVVERLAADGMER